MSGANAVKARNGKPVAVILNPTAGGHRQGYWKRMESRFAARFGEFTLFETEQRGHATELARQALDSGHKDFISCGGDGTLNEVINGLVANGGPMAPDTRIWVAPGGTATDSVRWLRRNGRAGTWVNADVGEAVFTGHDGGETRRCFVNAAGFGISGLIARDVEHAPRFLGGRFAFLWAVLLRLPRFSAPEMRVETDGAAWNGRAIETAVANGGSYGGGIPIAPEARFDSNQFEVVHIRNLSWFAALRRLPALYRGRLDKYPDIVQYARGTRVRIETDPPIPVNLDGEVPGMTPATITMLPWKLPLALAPV